MEKHRIRQDVRDTGLNGHLHREAAGVEAGRAIDEQHLRAGRRIREQEIAARVGGHAKRPDVHAGARNRRVVFRGENPAGEGRASIPELN